MRIFFIGGSVFFEKQERTLGAIISTPLRFSEYLAAKLVVLSALSLFVALIVVSVAHGIAYRPLPLIVGVLLGTLVMLLVGFITSMPFTSVSDWFISSTVWLVVMSGPPVLHFSDVWPQPALYVIPTLGPLMLMGEAFDQVALAPWQVTYAVIYPVVCAGALWWVAKAAFDRFVVARSGA
ncbi:fluoroquinolone transporter permease [Mycolicibacterium agri]|uniref:Fluoroquinolone transporter permease n=1 Tax=Mycolicibacterium agri TaxID=36811 RepID=A0A2A7MTS4_MYCAG|nr:fluoroquinolone transporter permease [Mycolicibacterium agri]GFG49501.1 hypothetical protein MAGR_09420 [Mycolicibacterium agri]